MTVTKTRSDSGTSVCRLSTLGRIAKALEVDTKELYNEVHQESYRIPIKKQPQKTTAFF